LRARVDLGARLPFILRKFPRNDDYARADLGQVFGARTLQAAQRNEATNFGSGAFLSQPDGTYRFERFPREAQIGPMQGIVAADLDGDGIADVCAVQNTDIAIPRFDGGVGIFLHGKGDGTFRAATPAESGVIVPGNARALVRLDRDEDARPGLFLTRLGGPTQYLVNGVNGAHWLRVQLRDQPGNPDAIGAKLQVVYSDGRTSHHEIGLGGGWLSQSAPGVTLAVPEGKTVTKVLVTWPDGQRTHAIQPPAQGRWLIAKHLQP
jgi:hypothetical protein